MIEIRTLITEFRRIAQHQEPMCKAFRNVELLLILVEIPFENAGRAELL